MWVCRPATRSATGGHRKNGTNTLPSAQSSMSWSGKFARCMDVVHSHTGKPSKTTTAQKDRITRPRVLMLLELSDGGNFRAVAELNAILTLASSEAVSIPCVIVRAYYPGEGTLKRVNGLRSCLSKQKRNLLAPVLYPADLAGTLAKTPAHPNLQPARRSEARYPRILLIYFT